MAGADRAAAGLLDPLQRRLDGDRRAFGAAYDRYIAAVLGRYRGRAVGWDCVNEPILDDGSGLRPSRWATNLGAEDHIVRAFEQAHAADPGTVLFLNAWRPRPPSASPFSALSSAC